MDFYRLGLMVSSLLLDSVFGTGVRAQEVKEQSKKNVLFLIVDDLRTELNCYGVKYMKTPNIDRLAAQGVMFENAYCNVPVSGASRASLFSGLRPGNTRYWDVNAEIDREAPGTVTLPQYFRENGYITISNSKVIHGKNDARERSWDKVWKPKLKSATWRDYLGEENLAVEKRRGGPEAFECIDVPDNAYSDGQTADKTIGDLRRLKKSGQPFFLAAGILKPHLPFNAPKKYWDMYDAKTIRLPETFEFDRTGIPDQAFHTYNEIRYYKDIPSKSDIPAEEALKLIHGYRACVSYADAQVGRILDELKKLDLDKNTIVVLLGDHGWSLGDHNQWCKHSNFNIVNNAPLIIRMPGNKKKGPETKVVEFVDVYTTLCEAAGLAIHAHTEGESMMKLLTGEDKGWKNCAVVKWHNGITYFDRDFGYTQWNDRQDNFQTDILFVYRNDYLETKNMAGNPEYKETITRLQQEIRKRRGKSFMAETPKGKTFRQEDKLANNRGNNKGNKQNN